MKECRAVVEINAWPRSALEGDNAERRSLRTTIAGSRACEELTHRVLDHGSERVPARSCVLLEISKQAVI